MEKAKTFRPSNERLLAIFVRLVYRIRVSAARLRLVRRGCTKQDPSALRIGPMQGALEMRAGLVSLNVTKHTEIAILRLTASLVWAASRTADKYASAFSAFTVDPSFSTSSCVDTVRLVVVILIAVFGLLALEVLCAEIAIAIPVVAVQPA